MPFDAVQARQEYRVQMLALQEKIGDTVILSCGMDIVEFKNTWPRMVWSGGVDGVDLMERGTADQVREEVRRHIVETRALETGGMFVASSSEINPPIPPENFRAMVEEFEAKYPGTMFSIVRFLKEAKELGGNKAKGKKLGVCQKCGEATSSRVCKACKMVERIGGKG